MGGMSDEYEDTSHMSRKLGERSHPLWWHLGADEYRYGLKRFDGRRLWDAAQERYLRPQEIAELYVEVWPATDPCWDCHFAVWDRKDGRFLNKAECESMPFEQWFEKVELMQPYKSTTWDDPA